MLAPPRLAIRWSDPRLRAAWVVLFAAAVITLAFLPKTMINGDEYLYAGQARMLLHGHLVPRPGDPFPSPSIAPTTFLRYPLGWPSLLALAAPFGFRAMFAVPLVMHLLGGAAFARMLARRGLPAAGVALYVFHPVFWSLSRTLMSDVPTAALLLIAMDAWENDAPKVSALGLGYALFSRVASVVYALGFGLAVIGDVRRRRRDIVIVLAGGVLAVAGLLLVHQLTHGHPYRSPYSENGRSLLNGSRALEHVLLYGGGLALIPPFPLLWVVLAPRRIERWALAAIPPLAFFVLYSYHDYSTRFLETFFGGQRLIVPAHAILMVATANVWGAFRPLRWAPAMVGGGAMLAVAQCLMLRHLYQRYEPIVEATARCAPRTLAFNLNASRVALSVDAEAYAYVEERVPEADVAVIALRAPTNQVAATSISFELPEELRAEGVRCRQVGEFYLFDLAGRCSDVVKTTASECVFPDLRVPIR